MGRQETYEIRDSIGPIFPDLNHRFGLASLGRDNLTDAAIIRALKGGADQIRACLTRAQIPTPQIEDFLEAFENGEILGDSPLTLSRQIEILEQIQIDIPASQGWQEIHEQSTPEISEAALSKPSWLATATTPFPQVDGEEIPGHRVSFAFYKRPCEYRKKCAKGCRFCGLSYPSRNLVNVTPEQQLASLEEGLKQIHEIGGAPVVFEILPDGSFLNSKEVPKEVQIGMMKRLSQEEAIKRVAVETRPEHCNPTRIRRLLKNLRPDQGLDLYLGLESTDDFVSTIINNKGYVFEHVKQAIRILKQELEPEELARLNFSVYNIMKSAYVTDSESSELTLKMLRDVRKFAAEVGVPIEVSCQPCVISKNTLQNYLYNQVDEEGERRYKPLSYFAVAETIALAHEEDPELAKMLKFGQRDDIDIYTVVAMVAQFGSSSMFSQFDFMVYNAVQRFNCQRDIRGFLVDMQFAVIHSPEFAQWEMDTYGAIGVSALSDLVRSIFLEKPLTPQELDRQQYQKNLFAVCDAVEYNDQFSDALRKGGLSQEETIRAEILNLFGNRTITVKEFILVDSKEGASITDAFDDVHESLRTCTVEAAFQIEVVIWNEDQLPQSIWVRIPLKPEQLPQNPLTS